MYLITIIICILKYYYNYNKKQMVHKKECFILMGITFESMSGMSDTILLVNCIRASYLDDSVVINEKWICNHY